MTVEQAQQILAGNPTQEELFTALLVLAENDETAYVAALPRAAELLGEMSGSDVSREDINTVVRRLQTQTQETQEPGTEVTLGETEAAPTTPQAEVDELTQSVQQAPTDGIEVEEDEDPPAPPPPFIGNVPAHHGRSVVSHPGQRVETVGGPRYRAGDEWDPSRLSPREIRRKQKELEKAGLLEPGSYIPGFWDKASADALNGAMSYANIHGGDVETVLQEMASLRPAQRKQVEQFIPPPEVKPDPAEITQVVKRAFRSRLGREPTDEELSEYGGFLRGRFAAQHDVNVASQRAEFEARQQGTGDPASVVSHPAQAVETVGGSEGGGMPSFTGVSPIQAFFDRMDREEKAEIDRLAALPEVRENMNNVFASLRTMGSLVG